MSGDRGHYYLTSSPWRIESELEFEILDPSYGSIFLTVHVTLCKLHKLFPRHVALLTVWTLVPR